MTDESASSPTMDPQRASSAGSVTNESGEPTSVRRLRLNDDRVVGLIVGVAVGDALGWPQEDRSQIVGGNAARDVPPRPQFRSWERNAGSQYGRYLDLVQAGEYSDDTQLMLAVARSCQRHDWIGWLTDVELPFWPVYQRGGGGAVLTASRAWGDGSPPWTRRTAAKDETRLARYFDAGANGVAMRIAPHAVITAPNSDETELVERVIRDGITTHGHPRALVGAAVHAVALRYALTHEGTLEYGELLEHVRQSSVWRDPELLLRSTPAEWAQAHEEFSRGDTRQQPLQLWARTCNEVDELLDVAFGGLRQGATTNDQRVLADLGTFDKKRSGAGTVTAVGALYIAARTASRPVGGLLRSGFLHDADTDTLCSMTASLLGAVHGTPWLGPLFGTVQDRDYLVQTALRLAQIADVGVDEVAAPDWFPSRKPSTTNVRRWTKAVFDGLDVTEAPDGRRIRLNGITGLRSRTNQHVARVVATTHDGQSLVIDRVSKTPFPGVPGNEGDRPTDRPIVEGDASRERSPRAGDRSPSPVPGQGAGVLAAVEIRVRDAEQTADFFSRVFGMPYHQPTAARAVVGDVLVFVSAPNGVDAARSNSPVVAIRCDDLDQAYERAVAFPGAEARFADDGVQLWLREPGGTVVRVFRGPTRST